MRQPRRAVPLLRLRRGLVIGGAVTLFSSLITSLGASNPANGQPSRGAAPRLVATQARAGDLAWRFAELTQESVLADAFCDEPSIGKIETGLEDPDVAFTQTLGFLGRRTFKVGRVRVARHPRWLLLTTY